ncbi:hypothetical protein [Haloferax sp. Q22]|uniref:biosurfactant protein 1 n=1 Tax=Haloferax sp. (strain Q22) TaxID=1526048 RepID=UPI000737C5EB|nr:hypothetical protein [Haloferax sp. Q22]
MTNHYSDFEELRPLGEATRVPDDELSGRGNAGRSEGQRREGPDSYPDRTKSTRSECSSCSSSIPANRTKCRFCLSNHLDGASDDSRAPDTEWTLLHVVHLLVEASTFYAAVAKGAAAATLLPKADRDPVVDDCQLLYDLNAEPAAQLTDQWPSLPPAVQVTSESGAQVLAAARERTTWTDTTQSPHDGEHATFLYDETGSGIRDETRLATLLTDADDGVWLVPAIAVQQSVEEISSESPRRESSNRKQLVCRDCGEETAHRFLKFEAVPDDEWAEQSMWECQWCGTPRYGPDPKAD